MYAQTIQNYGFLVLFIASVTVLGAILLAYSIGYRRGLNAKKLVIESLSFKQAMKWWAVHELMRHEDDKRQIRADLKKLSDVKMPSGLEYSTWVDVNGDPKIKAK